ncbi:MAG: hypothetical protein COC20_07885 [Cellvibrionales bacterium]|nr:MAG: hypothetical protein COC20_07885 [Cellvibrionales bacterium]
MNNSIIELRTFIGITLDGVVYQLSSDSLAPLRAKFNNSITDAHSLALENQHIILVFLGQTLEQKASYIKNFW